MKTTIARSCDTPRISVIESFFLLFFGSVAAQGSERKQRNLEISCPGQTEDVPQELDNGATRHRNPEGKRFQFLRKKFKLFLKSM